MRHYARLLFGLIAFALALPSAAREGKVGIVLLHGKQSPVPGPVGSLAQKLRGAGYLAATPEMPWSRDHSQASAKSYLSYFDPDGPTVMPANAAAIRSAIAILWVVGTKDPATRPSGYAFDKAPPHPKSKYVAVDADHLQVPAVAADQVLAWLRSLDH
jgi:hypothetical protein